MLARLRKMQEENEGGFTLIELLVVIIIIGILAAIAIPVFLNQRKKGYDSAAKSDLRNFATAEESYLTDYDAYSSVYGTVSTAETVKGSKNVSDIAIALDGTSDGYCLGIHSRSGSNFFYDSEAGGLQNTAYADQAAVKNALPTGACAKATNATGANPPTTLH
ncbi:MAG TPA: prepilin-type N-terminal cleavage/methylation domain-containing protein [Mycobacteriales bacterium]|nr:prepilin-type N-terminal cleavage/methylation domain-containing protein [Mycobacteriales bacterium]